ncbi:MAG TPA: DUF6600 domain-containing protein [Alphaproteobacteria bacterium]|nr:DUF6600 domain-containing protein [Alphaproteobacteria bacterium]
MSLSTRSFHRIVLATAGAFAILAATLHAPAQAQAARPNGYPVTNVNLRAGPGTYYPVIVVVPTHAPITVIGCLGDYTWCDVFFQGNRGWMRSIYLKKWYQGYYYALGDYAPRLGLRVVSFDIGPYWDANYRNRPFYRDRSRWGGAYGEGWANRTTFYDRLAPYGNWIWLQGQYVWVPGNVGPYWRPYTVGRWVYTDRYGWMWSSREPFGWATYHYGRWGFSNRVGWFWVPGSRWAPAWVSWRQSNDYLAWAPLPPTPDEGLGLTIRVGTIPDYYWQVVPTQDFLDDDLPRRIVRDRGRFNRILRQTQPLGNVTVVNNTTVVNNVVNINTVEQKTRKKVIVHKVERTRDAKQAGKVEGAAIEVFQPPAEETPKKVAPPKAKPIEEVAAESETKQQAEGAPATEEALVPAEIKALPEAAQGGAGKQKKGKPGPSEAEAPPPPPAADGEAVVEEAAPPPPPPPAEAAAPPPPAPEETPPSPPPAPVEEAPPPAKEEAAPAAPPLAPEEATPPPPPADQTPPPPAEEVAPPPPPAEEATPKLKPEKKQKPKQDKGEKAKPAETPAVPPPPPPQEESAPPPPPATGAEPPLTMKKQGKPKKERGERAQPGQGAPSFGAPQGQGGDASASPPAFDKGQAKQYGKEKRGKGRGGEPGAPCPDGMMPLEDGSCVPVQ